MIVIPFVLSLFLPSYHGAIWPFQTHNSNGPAIATTLPSATFAHVVIGDDVHIFGVAYGSSEG